MYNYAPNTIEFNKGYALGVQKGRVLERKYWLGGFIAFVVVYEVVSRMADRFICN